MALPIDFAGTAGQTLQAYNAGFALANSTTGSLAITAAGRLRRNATVNYNYTYSSELPPSADYWVEADFFFDSTTRTERFGITGRNSTSALTFYLARVATDGSATANVQLWKWVAGTATQLGSSYAINISGDPTFKIRLDMAGSTIRVLVNGVERINVTDSSVTAAGRIGFYGSPDADTFGDTTGMHLDNYTASFAATDVVASGAPPQVTVTAPTGEASATGGDVEASGSPSTVTVTAPTGAASSGLPLALLWNFDGSNASIADSVITNAESSAPTLDLVMRNPEGGLPMWQHIFCGLQNPDSGDKTVTVNVDLANMEGGNTILSTWSGPYKAATLTDHTAWQAVSRSATGGVLTFVIVVPGNSSIYIASMPPNSQAQIESRIAEFATLYPALIHDDLPSRIAEGGAPYVVDIAPTIVDELGRTFSGRPMLAARFGNDAVGVPMEKPRILIMANRHPGEVHGNFQMWGFLHYWASSTNPLIVKLRNETEIWVLFNQATNGIAAGYRRHEPRVGYAPGDDINREWKTTTLNHIAKQWIDALVVDHGATFSKLKAVIDLHDLSYSTQLIVYYYRTETPNLAALRAIIDARFTDEIALSSSNTDTATDFFVNTVGAMEGADPIPAFTAEVSDQATSLEGFAAVGAGWADIVASWYDTGLLGGFAGGAPTSVTVTAPTGSASAEGADVVASGEPSQVSVSAPTGSATGDVAASGAPTTVSVTAPSGGIVSEANASGAPPSVTITAPSGAATGAADVTPTAVRTMRTGRHTRVMRSASRVRTMVT